MVIFGNTQLVLTIRMATVLGGGERCSPCSPSSSLTAHCSRHVLLNAAPVGGKSFPSSGNVFSHKNNTFKIKCKFFLTCPKFISTKTGIETLYFRKKELLVYVFQHTCIFSYLKKLKKYMVSDLELRAI